MQRKPDGTAALVLCLFRCCVFVWSFICNTICFDFIMSAIRKLASHNIKNLVRAGCKAPVVNRSMSSLIERKEHADEAKYIRNIEAARKAEIRANLDRILALEDSHEDKSAVVELLGDFFRR